MEGEGPGPLPDADSLLVRVVTMHGELVFPGVDDPRGWNSPELLAAEFPGAGGQLAFGDDEFGVGFSYNANLMGGPGDVRADRLLIAVRKCLER